MYKGVGRKILGTRKKISFIPAKTRTLSEASTSVLSDAQDILRRQEIDPHPYFKEIRHKEFPDLGMQRSALVVPSEVHPCQHTAHQ